MTHTNTIDTYRQKRPPVHPHRGPSSLLCARFSAGHPGVSAYSLELVEEGMNTYVR